MNQEPNRPFTRRAFLRSALSGAGVLSVGALLAACGGGAAPAASPSRAASSAAPASTPASSAAAAPSSPAASPSASAAATTKNSKELKIGILAATTGSLAAIGQDINRGTDLYLDQHKGSFAGLEVTVLREDETTNPATGLLKARKLIEQDKVDAIMGIVSSATALAVRDTIDKAKIPLIISNAAANDMTGAKKSKYIFRTSFSSWQAGTSLAKWTAQHVGKKALVMGPDYAAGHEIVDGFVGTFKQYGGEILGQVFPPLGNSDYGPYLGKVKTTQPEVVWAFFSSGDAQKFVQQYGQFVGTGIPLVGYALNDEKVVRALGKAMLAVKSCDHCWDSALDNPENKAMVEAYVKKYNEEPNIVETQWDGMYLLDKALQMTSGDKSADALVTAMEKVPKWNSPRGPVYIEPESHGLVQRFYRFATIEEGGKYHNKVGEILGVFTPSKMIAEK
ncbi:MAG: ABC transporter substrate-binding protein [Chloroflexota bacterium]|nr:ABC transporter substrate-binding protein [Chloroflexota bacterium]